MIRGYIEILTHCPNGGTAVEDNVLCSSSRIQKSCGQIPGLKEAQLRAASTGKANKVTQGLIRITGESSERVMTDTSGDGVNRQAFVAAQPLRAVKLKIPKN